MQSTATFRTDWRCRFQVHVLSALINFLKMSTISMYCSHSWAVRDQNGETTCRQLSKRMPDNNTIFAAEATAISLALNYYQHMGPVHHDVVVYSDSMSCLQAIEGEDTENPLICHIMNLLWSLSDKGTHVRFCWVPSHCGIDGNERVDTPQSTQFFKMCDWMQRAEKYGWRGHQKWTAIARCNQSWTHEEAKGWAVGTFRFIHIDH